MSKCPYCDSEEVINDFPSANQGPGNTKYVCGTEIVHLSEDYLAWDCRNGVQPPPIDYEKLVRTMDEEIIKQLKQKIKELK